MDELRIHQLTKEMVAEELRQLGDPCRTTAAVVRRTLSAALGGAPDGTTHERIIEDAVRGAMTALLLADHDLARGTVLVLGAVLEASEPHVAPSEAMRSALRGAADLRRFVDHEVLEEIRAAICVEYMGASEVFSEYLRAPLMMTTSAPV